MSYMEVKDVVAHANQWPPIVESKSSYKYQIESTFLAFHVDLQVEASKLPLLSSLHCTKGNENTYDKRLFYIHGNRHTFYKNRSTF